MAAAEIQFVPGKFQTFRAIAKIHLGKLATDIREGDIVQFDGQTIKLGGVDHHYPELRAGIKIGWVVPEKDNISNYVPKAADMKIRAAQDNKKAKVAPISISDDERDVGPARPRKVIKADDQEPEGTEVKSFSRELKNQDVEERSVGSATPKGMQKVATKEMQTDSSGNEDARTIGRIRTPAVQKTVISDGAQAAREAAKLDNDPPPRAILPSKKGTEIYAAEADKIETILDTLNPEDRARINREQRATQAKTSAAKVAAALEPEEAHEEEAQAPAPAPLKAVPPVRAAPVAPVKAVVKKAPVKPQTIEQVVLAGDEIDLGDGLKWDMKIHWLMRVKAACDLYAESPESFEKVLAIESPAVVKHARTNLENRLKRA